MFPLQNQLLKFAAEQKSTGADFYDMTLSEYKTFAKEAELGDLVKMRDMIDAKKLFCVAWLLCAQEIFVN